MITQIEKAKELIDRFKPLCGGYCGGQLNKSFAKQCALIAVEELIQQQESYNNGSFYPNDYWKRVKQEIEIL
jgi:hypothetical protein